MRRLLLQDWCGWSVRIRCNRVSGVLLWQGRLLPADMLGCIPLSLRLLRRQNRRGPISVSLRLLVCSKTWLLSQLLLTLGHVERGWGHWRRRRWGRRRRHTRLVLLLELEVPLLLDDLTLVLLIQADLSVNRLTSLSIIATYLNRLYAHLLPARSDDADPRSGRVVIPNEVEYRSEAQYSVISQR